MSATQTRRGGRPRKGHMYETRAGWRARVTVTVDGESVQRTVDLGTTDERAARRKLRRLLAEENPAVVLDAVAVETFQRAAERIVDGQILSDTERKNRKARLARYVYPHIGRLRLREQRGANPDGSPYLVDLIRPAHIASLLEAARDAGKSRQTLVHIRKDIGTVFAALWREESVSENPVAKVAVPEPLPDVAEESGKERAVLADDELARYLAWQHPDAHHAMAVLERQVMSCVARLFGGLRTSDLHAVRWELFDCEQGAFAWGYAPRRKTRRKGGKPQRLVVPEMLRPILADWWERHGRPTAGLVFPKRRGEGAGAEARKKTSHAKAFRRDLRRAFGLDAWDGERARFREDVRPMTPRERVIFTETADTLPVDFHSWRRSYSQALAEANVNAQQAKALAGHASEAAHARYLQNSQRMLTLPEAALPKIQIAATPVEVSAAPRRNSDGPGSQNSVLDAARAGSSAVERWPYKRPAGDADSVKQAETGSDGADAETHGIAEIRLPRKNVSQKLALGASDADLLLGIALSRLASRIALSMPTHAPAVPS